MWEHRSNSFFFFYLFRSNSLKYYPTPYEWGVVSRIWGLLLLSCVFLVSCFLKAAGQTCGPYMEDKEGKVALGQHNLGWTMDVLLQSWLRNPDLGKCLDIRLCILLSLEDHNARPHLQLTMAPLSIISWVSWPRAEWRAKNKQIPSAFPWGESGLDSEDEHEWNPPVWGDGVCWLGWPLLWEVRRRECTGHCWCPSQCLGTHCFLLTPSLGLSPAQKHTLLCMGQPEVPGSWRARGEVFSQWWFGASG